MIEYMVTVNNGDYPLTYRAVNLKDAFLCLITAAEEGHLAYLPDKAQDQLNTSEILDLLVYADSGVPLFRSGLGYQIERRTLQDTHPSVPSPSPVHPPLPVSPVPDWLEVAQNHWRRFELTVSNKDQLDELNAILNKYNLSRRELAVITSSLRVRPEFSLADFRI